MSDGARAALKEAHIILKRLCYYANGVNEGGGPPSSEEWGAAWSEAEGVCDKLAALASQPAPDRGEPTTLVRDTDGCPVSPGEPCEWSWLAGGDEPDLECINCERKAVVAVVASDEGEESEGFVGKAGFVVKEPAASHDPTLPPEGE